MVRFDSVAASMTMIRAEFTRWLLFTAYLSFVREYWEEDPSMYPESEAMSLGYYGA